MTGDYGAVSSVTGWPLTDVHGLLGMGAVRAGDWANSVPDLLIALMGGLVAT